MEENGVIHPARFGEFLHPEQEYRRYPACYKQSAHWSITGSCNLRCRHCFMSAPHAKHGNPTHEQLMGVVDQLAECGVFQVGITGGEPLIRDDFLCIVEALAQREIGIDSIYTNGWLVDNELLDALEKMSPERPTPFQLSFDGVGQHDFLRGVPGAEERTLNALRLLQERGHPVNVSYCLHRGNMEAVRESMRLLASLGVRSVKIGTMMGLGEWANPEVLGLQLSREETFEFFERYIPQYFEDDAPLGIMLSGVFSYTPGNASYSCFVERPTTPEEREERPTCGSLVPGFYIGADGVVALCMGMADCGIASTLLNLYETPLREILGDSELMRMCNATVAEMHAGNDELARVLRDYLAGRIQAVTGELRGVDGEGDLDGPACLLGREGRGPLDVDLQQSGYLVDGVMLLDRHRRIRAAQPPACLLQQCGKEPLLLDSHVTRHPLCGVSWSR